MCYVVCLIVFLSLLLVLWLFVGVIVCSVAVVVMVGWQWLVVVVFSGVIVYLLLWVLLHGVIGGWSCHVLMSTVVMCY